MDQHPRIAFRDGPAGRRAVLIGSLDVWEVIGTVKAAGGSVRSAAKYLGIDPAQVQAAVRYYAAFPDEVDAMFARQEEAAAQQEEAALRKRSPDR